MKKRKLSLLLLAVGLLAALLCPVSAAVAEPTSEFYVYDGAAVLSEDTRQYIIKTNYELEQKTGAQIVVVTIPSLEGQVLEEYATELFRSWGIGDQKKNNGVLLLCAVEDRQFRVEVGYGLEGDLPDGKTGRMQDEYIIPLLKENDFDGGIRNGYSAFLQAVADAYDVTVTGEEVISYEEEEDALSAFFFPCLAISVAVNFVANLVLLKNKKPQGKKLRTLIFWGIEGVMLVLFSLVLQGLFNGIWVLAVGYLFSRGNFVRFIGPGGGFRGGSGGFSGGGFRGGGGFSGGGGRSGGGGSSRGF